MQGLQYQYKLFTVYEQCTYVYLCIYLAYLTNQYVDLIDTYFKLFLNAVLFLILMIKHSQYGENISKDWFEQRIIKDYNAKHSGRREKSTTSSGVRHPYVTSVTSPRRANSAWQLRCQLNSKSLPFACFCVILTKWPVNRNT